RCREGLEEIESLERSCPHDGFIRIGLFSQIFSNYLFVKCTPIAANNLPLNFDMCALPTERFTFKHENNTHDIARELANDLQEISCKINGIRKEAILD